jgi:ADP-ribosylglycohydrolase
LPTSDQLAGSLLGLALGDALGAPVEAFPPDEARRYVAGLAQDTGPEHGPGRRAFGQVTDDTQLARELLQSIVDQGRFDPASFARRLAAFVATGRLVNGGPGTLGAAGQLVQGRAWHEAGVPAPYAGNGAAMRAGPLGVLYYRNPRQLTRITVDQARVTHHDSRAIAGAVALAWAAAIAARREPVVPESFLEEVAHAMEPVDHGFARTVLGVAGWTSFPPDQAAMLLAQRGLEPEARNGWYGISSFVVSSVCWSLYAFLRAPEDFWDSVRVAIAVGGDTDTLASMTGTISGARLGLGALPSRLLTRIHDAGSPLAQDLIALADRVYNLP